MFSQHHEPVARFTTGQVIFNSFCVQKLVPCPDYIELLFNPIERMLAVRPCASDYPNAISWSITRKKSGVVVNARIFCGILFSIMEWDPDYTYKVPVTVRRKDDECVLFFDLDNYIGKEIRPAIKQLPTQPSAEPAARTESEETRGIFFGADDEAVEEVINSEEMEQKLRELAAYERQHFGTPVFEHNSDFRLTAIDDEGEWDVMAQPRVLGDDYRVDEAVIDALQQEMANSSAQNIKEQCTESDSEGGETE